MLVTNKVDYRYTTSDIPGSQPKQRAHRAETSNPLVPKYKTAVPQPEPEPPPPTKFIRDAMDVSDIEGTHAKKPRPVHDRPDALHVEDINVPTSAQAQRARAGLAQPRDKLSVADIQGASPLKSKVRVARAF